MRKSLSTLRRRHRAPARSALAGRVARRGRRNNIDNFAILMVTAVLATLVAPLAANAVPNPSGEPIAAPAASFSVAPAKETRLSEITAGSLLFRTDSPGVFHQATRLDTQVDMRISGMVLRATVAQRFRNDSSEWLEGIYVFPLPDNAAVDHLRMRVGERVIEGHIEERAKARQTYEQARKAGKKTSLVEQERPNLFTTSLANIGPGEAVTVEIEYQQTVDFQQGRFRLRFPMAITPRYIPGSPLPASTEIARVEGSGWAFDTDQVPDASRITPPVHVGEGKVNPVELRIELDAGLPLADVASPYHTIRSVAHDDGRMTVTLAEGPVPADRDFELVWSPAPDTAPRAALFTEQTEDALYHLLMLMPPQDDGAETRALDREVIYIIDTSGSMHGNSIAQARQALRLAVERLRPSDHFNIIAFNSSVHPLFTDARPADPRHLQRARGFIGGLSAEGGTEMAPALRAALDGGSDPARVRQVIFLTDGAVGNESALFDLIEQRLGDSRLFTIGIGSAPNSYFMTRAARHGRGTFTYIGEVREVGEKMDELFGRLESPVMRDLRVDWPDGAEVEYWPRPLPDLYLGEPLILKARTPNGGGDLVIRGIRGEHPWQARFSLDGGRTGNGIGQLWARARIASLMDSVHRGAEQEAVRAEVTRVALAHHMVSRFTSLVAVDVTPSRPADAGLNREAVAGNLPAGASYRHIFGSLPQTATPATLHLLAGLILLIAALPVLLTGPWRRATS